MSVNSTSNPTAKLTHRPLVFRDQCFAHSITESTQMNNLFFIGLSISTPPNHITNCDGGDQVLITKDLKSFVLTRLTENANPFFIFYPNYSIWIRLNFMWS